MKHLKRGRKLHRERDQRKALIKSLTTNLILQEKISTTLAKSKETQKKIERLITVAKKQNLSALRKLKEELSPKAAEKLYYQIAPRYLDRKGGYTRIVKTSKRRINDGSPLVILEFVK
ncbi:MAG TPA: 50S ribosomal protein L17 [Candidatus Paceibacterota bacterium]|nr:50S ribosomal protein L17 [Candidatus Paceibacterota bacterium]